MQAAQLSCRFTSCIESLREITVTRDLHAQEGSRRDCLLKNECEIDFIVFLLKVFTSNMLMTVKNLVRFLYIFLYFVIFFVIFCQTCRL